MGGGMLTVAGHADVIARVTMMKLPAYYAIHLCQAPVVRWSMVQNAKTRQPVYGRSATVNSTTSTKVTTPELSEPYSEVRSHREMQKIDAEIS